MVAVDPVWSTEYRTPDYVLIDLGVNLLSAKKLTGDLGPVSPHSA